MTREELIKKVALKMDEISSSDDVIVDVDTSDNNPLYAQINGLLNESVNDVLMKAPMYRIQSQTAVETFAVVGSTTPIELAGGRKAIELNLPENFLRLVSISDGSFKRPIVELAFEGDEVDKRQHNRHLVAKNEKPVAVLKNVVKGGVLSSEVARAITCYSYGPDDSINPTLIYIKRYDKDQSDLSADTDLDVFISDIVSWACAGRVFSAQGDVNKGKICDENAMSLMV